MNIVLSMVVLKKINPTAVEISQLRWDCMGTSINDRFHLPDGIGWMEVLLQAVLYKVAVMR